MSYIRISTPTTIKRKEDQRTFTLQPGESYESSLYDVISGGQTSTQIQTIASAPSSQNVEWKYTGLTRSGDVISLGYRDPYGNTKSTQRPAQVGDIIGNEVFTSRKQWTPLPTEFLQGKGTTPLPSVPAPPQNLYAPSPTYQTSQQTTQSNQMPTTNILKKTAYLVATPLGQPAFGA